MNQTNIQQRSFDSDYFTGADSIHPVLARVYAGRQIKKIQDTEYSLKNLLSPNELKGMSAAVELLSNSIASNERILIVGDYDVDGATSTTLAMEVLKAFGAKHVDYLVPDRFKYGYGLTPEIVDVALESKPDLIITVDNGIASIAGVEFAHDHGIKVLITDHHLPGKELPQAEAIVNPNQPGDEFASKALAGVGVIFYLMMALRANLRESLWFEKKNIPEPNLSTWLDLVALGTVADMVRLDFNNRILVSQGLARIQARKCRPGILSILEQAKRSPVSLSATDMGFVLAPRINAAGRLDDMSVGIECLLSDSMGKAKNYAVQLETLNVERREIQQGMQEQATSALKELNPVASELPQGISMFDARWHQGVVGLIASKIKEKVNRPSIAFARGDQDTLKGSARSVAGLNIRDLLDSIATSNPGLLIKFGGHAMAAGLSIDEDRFDEFSKAFAAEVERSGHDGNDSETILTDGELSSADMNLETAELLKNAGPWGQGFPEPVFEGVFNIVDQRIVGSNHLKLVLEKPNKESLDAIAFNAIKDNKKLSFSSMRATYRLDINEFRGQRTPQLIIEYFQED